MTRTTKNRSKETSDHPTQASTPQRHLLVRYLVAQIVANLVGGEPFRGTVSENCCQPWRRFSLQHSKKPKAKAYRFFESKPFLGHSWVPCMRWGGQEREYVHRKSDCWINVLASQWIRPKIASYTGDCWPWEEWQRTQRHISRRWRQ
jgi:hypothetical protein